MKKKASNVCLNKKKQNKTKHLVFLFTFMQLSASVKRISGEGFLLFSGMGVGSFGLLRNLRVVIVFTSMESAHNTKVHHRNDRESATYMQMVTKKKMRRLEQQSKR